MKKLPYLLPDDDLTLTLACNRLSAAGVPPEDVARLSANKKGLEEPSGTLDISDCPISWAILHTLCVPTEVRNYLVHHDFNIREGDQARAEEALRWAQDAAMRIVGWEDNSQ